MNQSLQYFRITAFAISFIFIFGLQFIFGQTINISTSGNGQFVVPANICALTVEVMGAGGGGGFSDSRGQTTGGGGGGAYAQKKIFVTAGQTINYSVGAGGSGGSGTNHGGNTWFFNPTTLFAEGGRGVENNSLSGGAGGSISNSIGDVKRSGGNGGNGSGKGDCHASGGGGSAAGPGANGNNGSNGLFGPGAICAGKTGGPGGVAVPGMNGGRGGTGATNYTGGQGNSGDDAQVYGAGGGGGKRGAALILEGGVQNGGNGSGGYIRITYHIKPIVSIVGNNEVCAGTSTMLVGAGTGSLSWNTGETSAIINVTPMVTTDYILTVTSDAGCQVTANHTVSVVQNNITPPTAIIGGGEFCVGNKVSLSQVGGSATGSYEWYENACGGTAIGTGNSIIVDANRTTTYYVRAAGDGVCPSSPCVSGVVTVPTTSSQLSLNGEMANCRIRDNAWVHFYKNGRLVASINSNGQNLGNVTATSYVDITSTLVPACDMDDDEMHKTSVMSRHWVISSEFPPVTPVSVRLPFYTSELNDLSTASIANANPYDNVYFMNDIKLSKYAGPDNVNSSALDNCVSQGGNGNTVLFPQNSNGNTLTYSSVVDANYTDFVINSFSEFWLHGQTTPSPLNTELEYFAVDCAARSREISLKVNLNKAIDMLKLEASENGVQWETINTFKLAGSIGNDKTFQFVDVKSIRNNYYRLVTVGLDGDVQELKTIYSDCQTGKIDFQLFPNPTNGKVTISWVQPFENAMLQVVASDGKVLLKKYVSNNEVVDLSHLSSGTYILNLQSESGTSSYQKLVKM